ncbi:MAG: PEP-CTERM sorting domain-containing protein [Pseudomonadota bacterium]|nr:PEP-CTERM sorting domain-containing protein [Pseudomonadota bacterium]
MLNKTIRVYAVMGAFALSVAGMSSATMAAALSASVGGVPVGAGVYENFDNLAATGGLSARGINVAFSGMGAGTASLPNMAGLYAAPFISGSNGVPFANLQTNGPDTTQYLTTGIGQITLQLDQPNQYFGLLWGSVDDYNTLSFYNGTTLLFNFTGLDVDGLANGNQGAAGTLYVNINSDTPFDRVVASSTGYGFEFDNVALAVNPANSIGVSPVPEPETYAMLLAGLAMVGAMVRRRTMSTK